jgi:hypothetical protein
MKKNDKTLYMKKVIIGFIILFSVVSQEIMAQQVDTTVVPATTKGNKKSRTETVKNDKKQVEVFRDRLIVDIFHAFWPGMPKAVNSNKFHPGVSVSALWDFKLPNNVPVSFGLGLGISYYSQYTDALLQMAPGRIMQYNLVPDTFKFARLNYINGYIPFEFRYRHKSGFKLTLGVRVGLVAEISQSYKGFLPDNSKTNTHYKTFDIINKQKYNCDVYLRIGWKFVNFYYSYQINKMFEKDKGPQISPMALGISLSIF